MANLTDADLDSQLVDLTAVPLAELRTLNTSALAEALEQLYATAEHVTGDEVQVQASRLGSRN
jgi:FXSXX-COOH protein